MRSVVVAERRKTRESSCYSSDFHDGVLWESFTDPVHLIGLLATPFFACCTRIYNIHVFSIFILQPISINWQRLVLGVCQVVLYHFREYLCRCPLYHTGHALRAWSHAETSLSWWLSHICRMSCAFWRHIAFVVHVLRSYVLRHIWIVQTTKLSFKRYSYFWSVKYLFICHCITAFSNHKSLKCWFFSEDGFHKYELH